MKYVSLFAGIGGFDLALNRLGHECVYANDFDKYCKIIYDKNFTNNGKYLQEQGSSRNDLQSRGIKSNANTSEKGRKGSDANSGVGLDTTSITEVRAEDIPAHDLLVGGFPCQSFSIAGKRRGFDDTRGTLFFDIARIIKHHKTKYIILENVKGLLNHDGGRTFTTIIKTLAELGYDCEWQVLNSKNFGVPQNRERVFIVGHLRGHSRPEVFPLRETNPKTLDYVGGILSEKSKQWLEDGKQFSRNFSQGSRVYDANGLATTLASQAGGLGAKTGLYVARVNRKEKVFDMRRTETTGALTATSYKEPPVVSGIRRLTPMECERLQGFPDGWTEGVSDTQRYKMCGNAVTVNVVQAVAERFGVHVKPLTK